LEKGSDSVRLLNLEKRIVDAELTVAQLNDKLKSLDLSMVSDLKQKEEDLEDLVLVNNAGINELKKMLESPAQPVAAVPDELKNKVEQLSNEVETLKQAKPEEPAEDVRKYIDDKLAEVESRMPQSSELNVDYTRNELSLIKTRLAALEKSMSEPKLSDPILNELQSIREDLLTVKSKVASTEKYTQDTRMDLDKLRPSVARLENIANFNPTIEQAEAKIEQMMGLIAKVDETIAKISAADFVSKGQLTDAVGKMNEKLNEIGKRLEGNRLFLIGMFKEDLNKAMSRLDASTIYSNVNKMV
jgi:hypothetical protein